MVFVCYFTERGCVGVFLHLVHMDITSSRWKWFRKVSFKKSTYSIYNLLNYHGGIRYHLFLSFRRPFSLNSIITLCSEVFSHFKSKTSLKNLVFHSLDNGFSWFIGNSTLKHLKGVRCSIYLSPVLLWILLASV